MTWEPGKHMLPQEKTDTVVKSPVEGGVRHPLPQIMIDKFDDYEAALEARGEVLKSIFKFQYKKAVYYGRIAEQCRRKFWVMVKEIYPEIGGNLTYHREEGAVSITGKGV